MNNNYDFRKDFPIAIKTEEEISRLLNDAYGWETIRVNDDNQYDLLVVKNGKKLKIEIKEDFTCARTNNIGVEFECRGKPSGISVSQADYYLFKVHRPRDVIKYFLINKKRLLLMIKNHKYHRVISGGDKGSNSKNYLFDYKVIEKNSKVLFT